MVDGVYTNTWISIGAVDNLHQLMFQLNYYRLDYIPRSWNHIAIALAAHGTGHIPLSLFHRGMKKPSWLMKLIQDVGFNF